MPNTQYSALDASLKHLARSSSSLVELHNLVGLTDTSKQFMFSLVQFFMCHLIFKFKSLQEKIFISPRIKFWGYIEPYGSTNKIFAKTIY